ncbi:MAG TPA: proteasome subunit beta [Candidatus Thermoplasmatota archaeon]|nr:proteasome subunit beta [Candidatus Thermoplasmatota archaeon]
MTTTVGIKTPEGIVLATDRRATMGYYVADKDVVKIEPLDDDSAITIAGSVAQAQSYAHMLRLNLEYTKNRRGWPLSPQELAKLAAYSIQRAGGLYGQFILATRDHGSGAGVSHLWDVGGDGSLIVKRDFTVTGSGTGPAIGVLESTDWTKVQTLKAAVEVASRAVKASIQRDVGSGNGLVVYTLPNQGPYSMRVYTFSQEVVEEGMKA